MHNDTSDHIAMTMEMDGKPQESVYIAGPEFSREVSNTNDLPSRSEISQMIAEKLLPDNIALKTVNSERPSLDFCLLLDKRISQVQNRISNFSKASRLSIDDFFVNNPSQRTSNAKLQKRPSLESLLDDNFNSPDVSFPRANQMQEPVQNRQAVNYKEIPSQFSRVSPQNKRPPIGGAVGVSVEPKKKLSLGPGGGHSESSISVLEFETSLAHLNKTKTDTPSGAQRRLLRFPSRIKGPTGHMGNIGDDSVDTPVMTEENWLEGDYLSFSQFPNSNKASGVETKELQCTNEELQQRQQEWVNNLQEMEVIEVVEEMEEEYGEEDSPEIMKKKRGVKVGNKTPDFVRKGESSTQLPPHVRKKIFDNIDQRAEQVKGDLVPQKTAEQTQSKVNYGGPSSDKGAYNRYTKEGVAESRESIHIDTDYHMKPSIYAKTTEARKNSPLANASGDGKTTTVEQKYTYQGYQPISKAGQYISNEYRGTGYSQFYKHERSPGETALKGKGTENQGVYRANAKAYEGMNYKYQKNGTVEGDVKPERVITEPRLENGRTEYYAMRRQIQVEPSALNRLKTPYEQRKI